MNNHQNDMLSGLGVEGAYFLLPRIYRLLSRRPAGAASGLLIRHIIDHTDAAEWQRVQDRVYEVLTRRYHRIDDSPPITLERIAEADPDLARSCWSRLCRDEYMPRSRNDLRVLEVATLALDNDLKNGSRQFRNFLHLMAQSPALSPELPPQSPPRPDRTTPIKAPLYSL